jgi:DNA-binding transcriptional ArsR family regulator|tara:strand:+ start:108 stop:464 length:357 start_codon:yes stop_codon:yes gene_type:complete
MDRIIISYTRMNVMPNDTSNESEKILEFLFEPDNAEILVELKDSPKSLSVLTKKIAISKEELDQKLSFLIEKGFLTKNEKDNEIFYSLDVDRLSKILENDDNFKNIDDGLAKLDSFLN